MLKVPFGLRADELVEPGAVPNGKGCGCLCPGCRRPLVAYNQGRVRTTQYFGHQSGDECAKGFESALHLAGKQAVIQAKRLNLPALEVYGDGIAPRIHKPLRTRVVEPATAAVYQAVDAEAALEVKEPPPSNALQADLFSAPAGAPKTHSLRADLKASRADDVDWIEIRVTHAVDARKRELMQHAGLRVVEIDLSGLFRPGVTLAEVRQAVIEDPETKTWLAHPAVPDAAAALHRELERESDQAMLAYILRQQQEPSRPQRQEPPILVPTPPPAPTEAQRLEDLREQLGLAPQARWPRYLDLDLPGNGGSLVSPRIWLSRLYLDWVRGRGGARYLVSDLEGSVAAKFGVKPRWGHRDLRQALERRVLPYWVACGLVTVSGEVVVVAKDYGTPGTAKPLR
ncbi:hypothetical protein ACS5PN_11310 [Roseateles sp. NT4]|uniref:hypothetical protein n=1 Tax=Roseateles sp. NT4 TaxID=3453715 RepID=UPI003EEB7047